MLAAPVAAAACRRCRRDAVVVETSRLVHVPWLDAFRVTTAGALLLGRIFSPWNLVAYAAGIVFGVWIDRLAVLRRSD